VVCPILAPAMPYFGRIFPVISGLGELEPWKGPSVKRILDFRSHKIAASDFVRVSDEGWLQKE
jgi:hypothetical protein